MASHEAECRTAVLWGGPQDIDLAVSAECRESPRIDIGDEVYDTGQLEQLHLVREKDEIALHVQANHRAVLARHGPCLTLSLIVDFVEGKPSEWR